MPKARDRIIIDTNLYISFLLFKDYIKLDTLFSNKSLVLLFSPELLQEFIVVAGRPKFKKYFMASDLNILLDQIHQHAEFIEVTSKVFLCRDPKDDFLLSLSKDGRANYLISGDKDLLDIKKFEKTTILSITDYLQKRSLLHPKQI